MDLGVVIPTLNCRSYLERHVEALNQWIDLAQEVVVVDSFSSDGTPEFLKSSLSHPNLRFSSSPPDLYASWNFGIQQIRSKYVAIATCGDTLSRAGIQTLHTAIAKLGCDVLISKPVFEDLEGRVLPAPKLPIDDVISSLRISGPRRLHPLEALAFVALHLHLAFTGSCASCLFRTEALQRFPFPTDFGTAGDGVWCVQHAAEVSWGVVPDRISTFLMHPHTANPTGQPSSPVRMDAILEQAMPRWLQSGCLKAADLEKIHWPELIAAVRDYFENKIAFDQCRKSAFPWVLSPRSWSKRARRTSARSRLSRIKDALLTSVGDSVFK